MRALLTILALFLATLIVSCGPAAPPRPVGEIPPAPIVLPEDEAYGREALGLITRTYRVEQNQELNRRAAR